MFRTFGVVTAASLLVALCSCSKQPGSESSGQVSMPGITSAGPTKADVQAKFIDLLGHFSNPPIALGEASQPQDCQAGVDGQQQVQACKVCFVVVEVVPREDNLGTHGVSAIIAERGMADVAFKKAISYAQPDIAPAGSGGVWVPSFGVSQPLLPKQPLAFTPISTHVLTPADFAKIGLSMVNSDSNVTFYNGRGQIDWPPDIIDFIDKYPLSQMVYPLVGTCQ